MAIDIDKILQKEAFKGVDSQRVSALKELMVRINGKSQAESVMLIMAFLNSSPHGKAITKAERKIMVEAIMEDLTPAERESFGRILQKFF